MNRRVFLPALAAGAAAVSWCRYFEPGWFEITHTRVNLQGIRPKRILHISDVHVSDGMTSAELDQGLAAGLKQRPDVICFTGDFVSTTEGFDRPGLRGLLRRAADTAPAYAVLGNHDGGKWLGKRGGSSSTELLRELLTSSGIQMLHNRAVMVGDLALIGVGDYWSGEFEPKCAFAEASPSGPAVVLCHNPDAKEALARFSWDLMLSGHTHGGQARIPGINPVWAPVVDKRFVAGLYGWEGRQLFITRGLGSPKHVRAFCRPEVSILDVG